MPKKSLLWTNFDLPPASHWHWVSFLRLSFWNQARPRTSTVAPIKRGRIGSSHVIVVASPLVPATIAKTGTIQHSELKIAAPRAITICFISLVQLNFEASNVRCSQEKGLVARTLFDLLFTTGRQGHRSFILFKGTLWRIGQGTSQFGALRGALPWT